MNIFGQVVTVDMSHSGLIFSLTAIFFAMIVYKTYKVLRMQKQLVPYKEHGFLLYNGQLWRRMVKVGLWGVALVGLTLALLDIRWGKKEEVVQQTSRDILIVLDISRSMLAQDEKPNRLEFAKQKIKKLLYNLSCERVGLLLFAGDCVVQCPLTTDYHAFYLFLDYVDAQTISSSSTALDTAIIKSLDIFSKSPMLKTKIICLFTDGEDFSGKLSGVKERMRSEGVSLFTIGIGTSEGAPVPVINKAGQQVGVEKDSQGLVVFSKLNSMLLKHLCEACGGKYLQSTATTDDDIKKLVSYIESFEKDEHGDKKIEQIQHQYPWFIALMLLALAVEWIV